MNKENTKTEFIITRVSKQEKKEIAEKCAKFGLTQSQYIRSKLELSQ